jgi:diketogulonate reductase-like aldo/keto reductase
MSFLFFLRWSNWELDLSPSAPWMLAKKPWIVTIPGTRKPDRLIENSSAAKIVLTETELQTIDNALSEMKLSAVYGGQNNRR